MINYRSKKKFLDKECLSQTVHTFNEYNSYKIDYMWDMLFITPQATHESTLFYE
jgi:hypothetical protein